MYTNEIDSYETKYDNNGIQIIKHKVMDIKDLVKDLTKWHDEITHIILSPSHLFYYATNITGSEKYVADLPEEYREDIKEVLELLVDDSDNFFDIYRHNCEIYEKVEMTTTLQELAEIMNAYGLKNTCKSKDLTKVKESLHKKLSSDYAFGIFGEILFYNVAENLLYNKLLLSKVQFVTAPGTNAHGSDGVFCDEQNKVLYFGEAKFTFNLKYGIEQAIQSMDKCISRINADVNFMIYHTKSLKNEYEHIISKKTINDYSKKVLIFLLHGEEIEDELIVQVIEKYRNRIKGKVGNIEFVIVSFPIYDKEHLKEQISKGVQNFGK